MPQSASVLVVAHQTAATQALLDAVRERAGRASASFHLVVPRQPSHRLLNPHGDGDAEAQRVLESALPKLSQAAGVPVTGSVGDSEPLMAIQDAINLSAFDEIIISTLPLGISRWLKLDLISKTRALGLPVTHVEAAGKVREPAGVGRT